MKRLSIPCPDNVVRIFIYKCFVPNQKYSIGFVVTAIIININDLGIAATVAIKPPVAYNAHETYSTYDAYNANAYKAFGSVGMILFPDQGQTTYNAYNAHNAYDGHNAYNAHNVRIVYHTYNAQLACMLKVPPFLDKCLECPFA